MTGSAASALAKLPVTAAILAGGRSKRMGSNKILMQVDGIALIARAVQAASPVCERIIVVTDRPEELAESGIAAQFTVVGDERPDCGPLGGLAAALAATRDAWVLAMAADMPWISPELIRLLWEARAQGSVVVPVTERGPEPLLALYHRDTLPMVRAALLDGRLGLRRLLATLTGVIEVRAESVCTVDPGLLSFINVNTPQEFELLREIQARTAPTGDPA